MNTVILSGMVATENICMRHTPEGAGVTSFVLKVPREYGSRDRNLKDGRTEKGDQPVRGSDYITVVCWNALADYAVAKVSAGMRLEVKGSIRTGKRVMKGYTLLKEGSPVSDFKLPVLEVHAQKIEISG